MAKTNGKSAKNANASADGSKSADFCNIYSFIFVAGDKPLEMNFNEK